MVSEKATEEEIKETRGRKKLTGLDAKTPPTSIHTNVRTINFLDSQDISRSKTVEAVVEFAKENSSEFYKFLKDRKYL